MTDTWPPEYLLEWAKNGCEGPAPEPPPDYEPSWERAFRLKMANRRPSPSPDPHRVRVDPTWWNVLDWECSYRYQAKCRCGWYGDDTKSKVTAEQQAEWHVDAKLDPVMGWA